MRLLTAVLRFGAYAALGIALVLIAGVKLWWPAPPADLGEAQDGDDVG